VVSPAVERIVVEGLLVASVVVSAADVDDEVRVAVVAVEARDGGVAGEELRGRAGLDVG
jgi:hypothetical protein